MCPKASLSVRVVAILLVVVWNVRTRRDLSVPVAFDVDEMRRARAGLVAAAVFKNLEVENMSRMTLV